MPFGNAVVTCYVTSEGFRVLRDELGVTGFIRFMQQFERGSGDYVKERQQWQQQHHSVDSILQAMNEQGFLKP